MALTTLAALTALVVAFIYTLLLLDIASFLFRKRAGINRPCIQCRHFRDMEARLCARAVRLKKASDRVFGVVVTQLYLEPCINERKGGFLASIVAGLIKVRRVRCSRFGWFWQPEEPG